MNKDSEARKIVVFDFDGTLVNCDSFIKFAVYAVGYKKFIRSCLRMLLPLVGFKLSLYSNSKAKEKLFGALYRGMPESDFLNRGRSFHEKLSRYLNPAVVLALESYLALGYRVYVITASVSAWVSPLFSEYPGVRVLATEVEIGKDGCLTGRFSTQNCNGEEKCRRLQLAEPDICDAELIVYGDSPGDAALFRMANKKYLCSKRGCLKEIK